MVFLLTILLTCLTQYFLFYICFRKFILILLNYYRVVLFEKGRVPVFYYGRYRLELEDHRYFLWFLEEKSFIIACLTPFFLLELGIRLLFAKTLVSHTFFESYSLIKWLDRRIYSLILRQEMLTLSRSSFENLLSPNRELKPHQHLLLQSCGHWLLLDTNGKSFSKYQELLTYAKAFLSSQKDPFGVGDSCWKCQQHACLVTIVSQKTYSSIRRINDQANLSLCPVSGRPIRSAPSTQQNIVRALKQLYQVMSTWTMEIDLTKLFLSSEGAVGLLPCGHWAELSLAQKWYLKHFNCFYCRTPRASLDLSEPYVFKHYLTYSESESDGPIDRVSGLIRFYSRLLLNEGGSNH